MKDLDKLSKNELIAELRVIREKQQLIVERDENNSLLLNIINNIPKSFVSIIEKDLRIGFSAGHEFKNQNLDPNEYVGLSLEQVFADQAPTVKKYYLETFKGKEQNFELFINEQYQSYKTVPLFSKAGEIDRILVTVENITEKRAAEIKLQESQNNLSAVFNTTRDSQLLSKYEGDKNFKVVAVNNSYINKVRQFGLNVTETDLIGKSLKEVLLNVLFLDQDVFDYTVNYYQKVINSRKRIIDTENFIINEIQYHSETSYTPIFNSEDGMRYVLYNSHDITKETETIQKLQRSEEKFRGIYEQSPIAIEIYDIDGKLIDVNQHTLNMFGIDDKKHVIGFNLWEDPNLTDEKMNTLKNGKPIFISSDFNFEIVKTNKLYPTSRSGIMYMDMYAIPLMEKNKIIGYLVQIIEVTDRVKAEMAMKESEERFREMFNNHNAVMLLIDPESGKIIDANFSAQNFYGIRDETLKQMTIQDINTLPEEKVLELSKLAQKENQNYFLFPHRVANGEIRTVEVHSSPIIINKKQILFSIIHDVTDRKIAEQELAKYRENLEEIVNGRTKELEMKNKELERFNNLFVDREFRIKELKDKINELEQNKKI